jgi:hypothetical protein
MRPAPPSRGDGRSCSRSTPRALREGERRWRYFCAWLQYRRSRARKARVDVTGERPHVAVIGAADAARGGPDAVRGSPDAVRGSPDAVRGSPDAVRYATDVFRSALDHLEVSSDAVRAHAAARRATTTGSGGAAVRVRCMPDRVGSAHDAICGGQDRARASREGVIITPDRISSNSRVQNPTSFGLPVKEQAARAYGSRRRSPESDTSRRRPIHDDQEHQPHRPQVAWSTPPVFCGSREPHA